MARGTCAIYGVPKEAGTFRLEFPIDGGSWFADVVIEGDDDDASSTNVHTISGKVGKYLGYSLSRDEGIVCGSKHPDWRRVTGNLPAGMARGTCAIYGVPKVAGTYRLEFPIDDGSWLVDVVITGEVVAHPILMILMEIPQIILILVEIQPMMMVRIPTRRMILIQMEMHPMMMVQIPTHRMIPIPMAIHPIMMTRQLMILRLLAFAMLFLQHRL